jgi:hypothetical protein
MHRMQSAATVAAIVLSSPHALGGIVSTYDVGSGANLATFQVDFSNGNGYIVNVRWDAAENGFTGFGATQRMHLGIAGSQLDYQAFSFGAFVTGIGIGADYEYGEGDLWPKVENFWHYWVKTDGQWEQAMFGPSDHVLTNGAEVAWVFGSPAAPQAVPAPGAAAEIGVACVWHRLRRRRR